MTNIRGQIAPCLALLAISGAAFAFELRTHAQLTSEAFRQSRILGDSAIAEILGIELGDQDAFGQGYFDLDANPRLHVLRFEDPFERTRMRPGNNRLSVEGWLMRGAIREDDLSTAGCAVDGVLALIHGRLPGECNPQDDPSGNINRVLNHFYDPRFDRGLESPFGIGVKAVNWALGTTDAFARPTAVDGTRRNHFSVADARWAMYYALSGRVPQGQTPDEATRKAWWATTFRALGDVMHVLQDMAQPQHTRNEVHPGSIFENYIEARARGALTYRIDGSVVRALSPLPLGQTGEAPEEKSSYFEFWSTAWRDGLVPGSGLADFSNRNFLTDGTNLGQAAVAYELPSRLVSDYRLVEVMDASIGPPGSFQRFLVSQNPETLGMRLSTESAFSENSGPVPQYSMNRYNYDDQAMILLPKAVAYSAGLLDYFFRGNIDLVKDPQRPGKYVIRNLGPGALSGRFALYYDDVNNVRRPVMRTGNVPLEWKTEVILEGGSMVGDMPIEELGFAVPADAREPGVYMLVFNGDMGEEKAVGGDYVGAVAGKRVDLRPYLLVGVPRSTYSQEMYRSTDFGASWEYWGDQYDVCGSSFGKMRYIGDGVILGECSVSRDGGRTWQTVLPLANGPIPTPTGNGNVLRIVDPQDPPGTPLVDTSRTFVQFSGDLGQTWSALVPTGFWGTNYDGPINVGDGVIVMEAGYPDPADATCPPPFNSTSCRTIRYLPGMYRSNDRGVTWAPIATPSTGYSNTVAGVYLGRLSRTGSVPAPAPDGNKTLLTWAQVHIGTGAWRNVLQRSFDLGATWEPAGTPPDMEEYAEPYFHFLRSLAYAGGGNVFAYFADSNVAGHRFLYRSRDYATTWERVGPMPPGSGTYPGAVSVIFVGDNGTVSDIR